MMSIYKSHASKGRNSVMMSIYKSHVSKGRNQVMMSIYKSHVSKGEEPSDDVNIQVTCK